MMGNVRIMHPSEPTNEVPTAKHQRRLSIGGELLLALLPTATILLVLVFLDVLTNQRLLFASLASSAFLIYLEPGNTANQIGTLVASHLTGVGAGIVTWWLLGGGYLAAGTAMTVTIVIMVVGDFVHPPAVSTSLIFGLRSGVISQAALFGLALGMVVMLVILERAAVWLLARLQRRAQRS